jgi:hypothetical protein
MGGRGQRWAGGLALAVALNGCGGGSEQADVVDTGTTATTASTAPESTTTSITDGVTTTTRRATTTTTKKKPPKALPGPATPNTPLAQSVSGWHADLTAMTTASCTRLVNDAAATRGNTALEAVIVLVYRGAGEGCLGQATASRTHLEQARAALAKLSAADLEGITPACRPQELLSWALYTYLDTDIPTGCEAASTTSTGATRTTSTTRTTLATTTTRRL